VKIGMTTPELYNLNPSNKLECSKCHAIFERGGKVFDNHVARCGGVPLPKKRSYRYPCFLCGKQFLSKVTSAEHMAMKHNFIIENPEKMCFECKEEVDDPMAHAKMHNCRFACSQCGLRFVAEEKLNKHFKERHENSDRPFVCDLCNSSFKTANHLRSHKTSMHTSSEDKKFVCEICDRRYPFQYQLNTHINSAHSEIRK
jgi:KRAB domain-containing zinc finger protein